MPAGGETEKKVTDTFTIKFEPASDWEFIRWKIVDSNTQTELENGDYLELSTLTDSETECTFLKSPGAEMALSLVPVMAERPQIISNTPQSSGVLKDTSIQVLFDHDMDEASIYYTQDEMNQLLKEGTADSPLFPETILNEGGEEETVYKGYEKDDKTFFKNIFISNKREGTNLNEAFEPPVFENSSSLIIRTKRVEKQNGASTHLEPLIQDYTQILVSVEKGMSYQMEGKSVGLAGSKRWMYNVGDGIDNIALNITSRTCDVKESGNTETLALDQNLSDEPNPSDIRSLTFFDGNSLDVDLDITVNDPASSNGSSGSGPRTFFKVNLNKVYDGRYYKLATPALVKEKTVDYNKNIRADSASFEGTVALDDLNLSDGVYELSFVFSDISGNDRISGGKYLAVDKSTPEPVTIVTCKYNSSSSLTLSWEKPASHGRDIVYSLSYSTDGTSWSSPVSCESLSKDFSISSSNNYYIYKVVAEDARSHKSTATTRKTYAKKMSVLWNKGFVEVEGASVSGTVSPSSSVFINGRTVHIPDLIVCDHEVTQK